jgi:hypothetical protein
VGEIESHEQAEGVEVWQHEGQQAAVPEEEGVGEPWL